MSLRGFLFALVIVTASAPSGGAAAPSSTAPDITRYDLDIRPDFATGRIRLRAEVRIDSPGRDSLFQFALGARYDVRVREGSRSLGVRRDGGWMEVAVTPRETHRLLFEIEGAPGRSDDEGRAVVGAHDLFLLWSDRFYPIAFDDWAVTRTTVTLPSRFQAIAPGRLVRLKRTAESVTYVFETSRPTRLVSVFADDRWIRSERRVGDLTIRTLLHPEAERFRDQIVRASADVVGYYRDLFAGYGFDGFCFVTIDSIYARRAFPGFVGYSPSYLEKEMARTGHDAHETALLWWGCTVGGAGPGGFQWIEGFGDYAEVLYDEARRLPLSHNLARARADYLATPADEDVPIKDLRGNTPQKLVHGKLPWLMHVIRYVEGDEAFRRAMRRLYERHRFRAVSLEEFIATLEEGLGSKLDWWRSEWLERKGVPDWKLEAAADSLPRGGYRVRCRIEQLGNRYHIPLQIGIEAGAGSRIERVTLSEATHEWTFDLPVRPVAVILDPEGWLLARVSPSSRIDLAPAARFGGRE